MQGGPKPKRLSIVLCAIAVIILFSVLLALLYTPQQASPEAKQPVKETAPLNQYAAEDFYMDGAYLRYRDKDAKVGIDVSAHQGLIDWERVAQAGVEFAVIRAGYRGSTKGLLYEDETFRANLKGATEVGISVGVYFFSQACTPEEAEEEAAYVCKLLAGTVLDLPVFYDWEEVNGEVRIPAASEIPMTECALAFCKRVEQDGYRAGVYFNQTYGYRHLALEQLQDYCLWLAEYGTTPTFHYHFDCLQYTDSGSIDGIETDVDLDLLFPNQVK